MKKYIVWLFCLFPLGLSAEPLQVLCTTFPIYQITRNVTEGSDKVAVSLLIPASLGCPHHYSLTPQDMQKLAKADIMIINGLGMEEFLGAPVAQANPNMRIIDSSQGIEDLLRYDGHDHGDHEYEHAAHGHSHHDHDEAFEWYGAFTLDAGIYTWSFAKVDGKYADPSIRILVRKISDTDSETIAQEISFAKENMGADAITRGPGDEVFVSEVPFELVFDQDLEVNVFHVAIAEAGTHLFFTEHMPWEFEADSHYFKDSEGQDIEPLVQQPEEDEGHGHAHHHLHSHSHDHDHHHSGVNPHLFASPVLSGRLALNIAAGLSAIIPEEASLFFRNATAYTTCMQTLADEMIAGVKTLRNNRIVQPHGVFDYLARDIGLEIVAVTQPHGQEPSAAQMLELIKTIRDKDAGAIFTEPQYSPRVGQMLARETGIPTATLDPGASGPADAPLDFFEHIMRHNLETLLATLGVKR